MKHLSKVLYFIYIININNNQKFKMDSPQEPDQIQQVEDMQGLEMEGGVGGT